MYFILRRGLSHYQCLASQWNDSVAGPWLTLAGELGSIRVQYTTRQG
jgi:hypothetical protein